jgi:hypothetical protein
MKRVLASEKLSARCRCRTVIGQRTRHKRHDRRGAKSRFLWAIVPAEVLFEMVVCNMFFAPIIVRECLCGFHFKVRL